MLNLKNALYSTWLLLLQCGGHTDMLEEMGTATDPEQMVAHKFWCFQQTRLLLVAPCMQVQAKKEIMYSLLP